MKVKIFKRPDMAGYMSHIIVELRYESDDVGHDELQALMVTNSLKDCGEIISECAKTLTEKVKEHLNK